jgi:hypothetical protein
MCDPAPPAAVPAQVLDELAALREELLSTQSKLSSAEQTAIDHAADTARAPGISIADAVHFD